MVFPIFQNLKYDSCMGVSTRSKRSTAAEAWRLLLATAMSHFGRTASITQELGLTPGHVKALLALDPEEPQTMGALAQSFGCDASTITWMVDRLEERDLVERRGSKNDRRVKTVALTPAGLRTKRKLEARLYEPPEEFLALDRETLDSLHRVLASRVANKETPSGRG